MYHVSARGVDERMINVHYYYRQLRVKFISVPRVIFKRHNHSADRKL